MEALRGVLQKFAALQNQFGRDLAVNSAFRNPDKNRQVGGAKNSEHLHGNALDIDVTNLSREDRLKLISMASAQGFSGIGVYDNSLHLDIGNRRAWGADFGRGSVPQWAEGAINAHLANSGAATPDLPQTQSALSTQPLALRRDGTIFGDAFDAAAIRAFSWRSEAALANDLGAAFDQFQQDPAGYNQAVGEIRAQYLENSTFNDPQLREVFDRNFTQRVSADRLKILSMQETRLRAEEQAAAQTGLDALFVEAERQAFNLGGNGDADAILAPDLNRVLGAIQGAEQSGVLSPAQAENRRNDLGKRVALARIQGTFEAAGSPAQQESFALGLLDEWAAGRGPIAKLSYPDANSLSTVLVNKARNAINQRNNAQGLETQRIKSLLQDDLVSMAQTGQGVDLNVAEVEAALSPVDFSKWQSDREDASQLFAATNGMEAQSQGDIETRLAGLMPKPGQEGFVNQQRIYEAALGQANKIVEQRQSDPLGQAQQGGLVALAPLDYSGPEGLNASLDARKSEAEAVAGIYGTPLTYLRPQEQAALSTALMSSPDLLPGFAASVVEIFGNDAPAFLGEISDSGPAIARATGIYLANGDMSIVADISRVLADRADGTYKINMPSDSKFSLVTAQVLGGAFGALPAEPGAVSGVAQLLFEQKANLEGFDPKEVDKPGTRANEAYRAAVLRALGQRNVGGVQFGGLVDFNGQATLVPPGMAAPALGAIMDNLSDRDMAALGPVGEGENALVVTTDQIKGGHLVAVADGQYRVALGEAFGFDPRWLLDASGAPFVLDISRLANVQQVRMANERLAQSLADQQRAQDNRQSETLPPLAGMMGGAL